ncbi:MAG: MoaD/ThiS family protein [Gemmataceae bacterium]
MPSVWVPAAFRNLTAGQDVVPATGGTVGAVVADLERRFPGLRARLCVEERPDVWRLRPGLAVVVGSSVARNGLGEPVGEEAEIHFVQAIGGGCSKTRQGGIFDRRDVAKQNTFAGDRT